MPMATTVSIIRVTTKFQNLKCFDEYIDKDLFQHQDFFGHLA